MCHCITPQALLDGLARRAEQEGYVPTRDEVRSLIRLGCARDHVLRALARGGPAAEALARDVIESLPAQ